MIRLIGFVNKSSFATQLSRVASPVVMETSTGKDKYRDFKKTGPQLFLTRILMVNGPLTNKEIWRIYQKKVHEAKLKDTEVEVEYWPSLTKMKQTIKFMRLSGKIQSNGYTYRTHQFSGWKIQEKRALKFVHPIIIHQIQQEIAKRDNL